MSQVTAATSKIEKPLGHAAARGFVWSMGQLLGVKVVNFVGQVILAWLLSTQDFGFVGLAFTVAAFTALIQQGGIMDVLVQRGHRFSRWSGPAMALSLMMGTLGAVLLVALAPVASHFYHEPRIKGLLYVLAVGGFFNCLTLIPFARLQRDLRFKFIAIVSLVAATFTMAMSVLLAWLGFGAYSFVVPIPLTGLLYLAILWPTVRPPMSFRRAFKRAKYFLGDNLLLLGMTFFWTITWQGDYIILGRLYPKEVVGLYYWAYNLSLQSLYLLSNTMANVLFPSLSRLKDEPERQQEGFLRAAKAIALVAVPSCLAQAALAEPAVHLLFKSQWYPAIPILQVLSLGMAFQVVGTPAIYALKAQGRFRLLLLMMISYAVAFVAMVYTGSRMGAALGAAIAVACFLCASSIISISFVLNRSARRLRELIHIYAAPLIGGTLAGGCGYAVVHAISFASRGQAFLALGIGGLVTAAVYLPLARWWARTTWLDLKERLLALLVRRNAIQPEPGSPAAFEVITES